MLSMSVTTTEIVVNELVMKGMKPATGRDRTLPFAFGSRLFRPPIPWS